MDSIDNLLLNWRQASTDLGFRLIAPFVLQANGHDIAAPALVPDFGGSRGTVVFSLDQRADAQAVLDAGFRVSFLNDDGLPYQRQRHRHAERLGLVRAVGAAACLVHRQAVDVMTTA